MISLQILASSPMSTFSVGRSTKFEGKFPIMYIKIHPCYYRNDINVKMLTNFTAQTILPYSVVLRCVMCGW